MLKTNSKVYRVYEFGGEYEDKWEHNLGVCSSLELAEELKAKAEAAYNKECNITWEEYDSMLNSLYEREEEQGEIYETDVEGLIELFPQYSKEELEAADAKYCSYDDYIGVEIEEIDFYN